MHGGMARRAPVMPFNAIADVIGNPNIVSQRFALASKDIHDPLLYPIHASCWRIDRASFRFEGSTRIHSGGTRISQCREGFRIAEPVRYSAFGRDRLYSSGVGTGQRASWTCTGALFHPCPGTTNARRGSPPTPRSLSRRGSREARAKEEHPPGRQPADILAVQLRKCQWLGPGCWTNHSIRAPTARTAGRSNRPAGVAG